MSAAIGPATAGGAPRSEVVGELATAALSGELAVGRAGGAPRLDPTPPGVRLVCIDGLAGAGKTTLAAALAGELRARGWSVAVVHMDDLYLGWGGLLGAADTVGALVTALREGEPMIYRRWDWHRGELAELVTVPRTDVVILEGCGSAPPAVDGVAALTIAVTAPDALRLERGLVRDGDAERGHWLAFMADEAVLAQRDRAIERADVVLDELGAVLRRRRVVPTDERR